MKSQCTLFVGHSVYIQGVSKILEILDDIFQNCFCYTLLIIQLVHKDNFFLAKSFLLYVFRVFKFRLKFNSNTVLENIIQSFLKPLRFFLQPLYTLIVQ